jgi:hypothetical protein
MISLSVLSPVLAILGLILLWSEDDGKNKLGGVLLALAFILGITLVVLDQVWKKDLRKLAGSVEYFAYVPPNGDVGTAPVPVTEEAVAKAVAGLSPWAPWGLIQTLESDEKKPSDDTDKFLEALAEASDNKKVRYTRFPVTTPP